MEEKVAALEAMAHMKILVLSMALDQLREGGGGGGEISGTYLTWPYSVITCH